MLVQVNKVDDVGLIIEPVVVNAMDVLEADLVMVPVPEGLYIPRWTGSEWIESASEEYKNSVDNHSKEPTEMEILVQENTLLKAQVQAATDRSDFHEELIAEMAMLVYS